MAHLTPGSIFDDLELFDPEEGANLKVRARLIDRIIEYIEHRNLSQEEAAEHFGVGQPRVSNLLNGQIGKFTIDALINMCTNAGIEVDVVFDGAANAA